MTLFEKFCEVMNHLQHGTHVQLEKSRSEMSEMCVHADKELAAITAERDALREALRDIIESYDMDQMTEIARAALTDE